MKPIDEHLFERLYVRFPKVGTLYYAMRQPIPIALLAFFGILLAVPCGIAVGIMHGVFATANEMSESVRTAAYRFKRYTANLKALWQVATIHPRETLVKRN